MSKKSIQERNKKRIKLNTKLDHKLKATQALEPEFTLLKKTLTNNSYHTRIKTICPLTSKNKHINQKLGLARMGLKEAINKSLIPGIIKKSW